ncbi:nuclear transport factor 2 family protein [Aminobacter anthyllidis]|uniref:Nuclear transport factor 2 family protein n=1 Tax=Aminobacter anthyllidis TaxID=1035067 RepID=A0A9X1AHF6_9HYPH|nr:nuclear transport factor 2 family protein [Aminobacter anthyllidis]MBT1159673.1 nuclear transport factor 2 family protein [Aminobacter anthyllidis]
MSKNQELLEKFCALFEQRDADGMSDIWAEDALYEIPLHDTALHGREEILHNMRIGLRGLEEIRIVLDNVVADSGGVSAEGTFYARNIGVPSRVDGRPSRLDFRFTLILEIEDGKIKRYSEYFDTRNLRMEERTRLSTASRRSPYWEGTVEAGVAHYMVYNHMFFPVVYKHSPAEEYEALTKRVTLWDVGCERQTEVRGPDALKLVQYITTRDLSKLKTGDCRYTLCCDPEGHILCDPVLLKPYDDVIWLSHGDVDLTLWARAIAMEGKFDVTVCEPDVAPVQIQGPNSLAVLNKLASKPVDGLGFYKCMENTIAGIEAIVSRTGWSGGLGYEVFPLSSDKAMHLWNAILEAGSEFDIMVIGPNINRAIEKGVTDTGYHVNSNMNPYEAGHGRLVHLEKEFIGRDALRKVHEEGPARQTVGLFIEGNIPLLEWFWPVESGKSKVGEVRWAAHSFALNRSLGIALVDASIQQRAQVTVDHPLGKVLATVTTIPFVTD